MPIALLLADTWRPLHRGMRRLAPWADVADRLALVAQRMGTGYLVRWFGPVLPTRGLALRVSFVNLSAVLARAADVRSRRQPTPADAGMAGETAMGLVGAFAGWVFSPGVQFAASTAWVFTGAWSWWKLVGILNMATLGGLSSGVFLALSGVAPLSAAAIGKVQDNAIGVAAAYEGIVAVAGPLQTLWAQLTGPRDKIRNPVLRHLMELADAAANLVPQLFGALAWLMVRLAPVIVPLALAVVGFVQFVSALVTGILEAVHSVVDPLVELFAPKDGTPLHTLVADKIIWLFRQLGEQLSKAFAAGKEQFFMLGRIVRDNLKVGWAMVEAVAKESILEHPLTKVGPAFVVLEKLTVLFLVLFLTASWNVLLRVIDIQTGGIGKARRRLGKTAIAPSAPSTPTIPPFPALGSPSLRPLSAIWTGAFDQTGMPPSPFDLTDEARRGLRYRPSVFGGAVADTARRWKDSAAVRADALRILPALRALLPAAARPYLADLPRMLGEPPPEPGAAPAGAPADLPDKSVAPTRLRPRIRDLYVELPAAVGRERADRWVARMRATLEAGAIPVPAVAAP
jgi:hypothetical protein